MYEHSNSFNIYMDLVVGFGHHRVAFLATLQCLTLRSIGPIDGVLVQGSFVF
jgi:hypothetical protein